MTSRDNHSPIHINRRRFILQTGKMTAISTLLSMPFASAMAKSFMIQDEVTVGDIIDKFISEIPGAPFPKTVDTLKSGKTETKVSGVVTTMFATIPIIKQAIVLGANFIIAHEPTFYNHADETDWLEKSDVYQYKRQLLDQHNIAVWRNHDYIHSLKLDGVGQGLLKQLEWEKYYRPDLGNVLQLPSTSLGALINYLKTKLTIDKVRYIGDINQSCEKILFLPGSAGGKPQITQLIATRPDVLVCGEIQEWETAEYVRDARAKGEQCALVVLGHIASEEPGSAFMANWLKENFPDIKATHIPTGNSLQFI